MTVIGRAVVLDQDVGVGLEDRDDLLVRGNLLALENTTSTLVDDPFRTNSGWHALAGLCQQPRQRRIRPPPRRRWVHNRLTAIHPSTLAIAGVTGGVALPLTERTIHDLHH